LADAPTAHRLGRRHAVGFDLPGGVLFGGGVGSVATGGKPDRTYRCRYGGAWRAGGCRGLGLGHAGRTPREHRAGGNGLDADWLDGRNLGARQARNALTGNLAGAWRLSKAFSKNAKRRRLYMPL